MKAKPTTDVGSRTFSFIDQDTFARLSGDFNPAHVVSLSSRRSLAGKVIVHDMHTLLWSLDRLAASTFRPAFISSVDVSFPKPVFLNEKVSLFLQKCDHTSLQLKAVVGDATVAIIRLGTEFCPSAPQEQYPIVSTTTIQYLDTSQIINRSGKVPCAVTQEQIQKAFPYACSLIGATRVLGFAACSRLVGTECHGTRSLFAKLNVSLTNNTGELAYCVASVDEQFCSVCMDITGFGLNGKVTAFCPPVNAPPSFKEDPIDFFAAHHPRNGSISKGDRNAF